MIEPELNNKMGVKGKVAIVTGAARGIGLEICKLLAKNGAKVIMNDIDSTQSEKALKEIQKEGGNCISVPGDCSSQQVIDQMIGTAVKEFGELNIVIANAGITLFGDFLSYEREAFRKVMSVNLEGTFFLAKAAALQMKKQNKGGSLLFMSSVTGHQAHKDLSAYGMTKAAIEMLAKSLVVEISPFKINVNALAPGATMTERTSQDPDYHQTWEKITPMGRPAYVNDIAQAALFLVSDEARHITGQSIIIDGGWTSVSPSPY